VIAGSYFLASNKETQSAQIKAQFITHICGLRFSESPEIIGVRTSCNLNTLLVKV
jgi:hypothetical protein